MKRQINRSMHEINILGFHEVCAIWIPKHLAEEHKHKYLDISRHLLNSYYNFFEMHCHKMKCRPTTAIQRVNTSMEWKCVQSLVKRKFKMQPTAAKLC
jgi:hypothetical protein